MELIVKNKDTAALQVMSELKNYNKIIFPYIKYLDIIGAPFIGKNILIVAKVTK